MGCLTDNIICPRSRFYVARTDTVHASPLGAGTIQQSIHAYSTHTSIYSYTAYAHRPAARVGWLYGIHSYTSYTIQAYSSYTIHPIHHPSGHAVAVVEVSMAVVVVLVVVVVVVGVVVVVVAIVNCR